MKILFKPQQKHPNHHHIWNSLYFYISMDFPIYIPTTKVLAKLFFGKSMAEEYPTYLQFEHMSENGIFFLLLTASLKRNRNNFD